MRALAVHSPPPAQFFFRKDVAQVEKVVQQDGVKSSSQTSADISPRGKRRPRFGNDPVAERRVNLQARFSIHEQSGLGQIIGTDDEASVVLVPQQINLGMERGVRFVVMDVGFDSAILLPIEKVFQALVRSVLNIDADSDLRNAASPKKVSEWRFQMPRAGTADPSHRRFDTVPLAALDVVSKGLPKPVRDGLIVEHGSLSAAH
jgi:hypothetical protein